MAAIFQFPYLLGFPILPARRLIAIDAGSHSIKILLVEKLGQRIRVLGQELINLHEEGLLSPEEIGPPLQAALTKIGEYPVALALPQHLPQSHILDLLSAGSKGVKQLIEAETFKNRDLRDSAIVYDCARLRPFGKHQNSFWVTLCKENDILQQVARLSLPTEDVCEIVSSANVLASAYQKTINPAAQAVLVDLGASSTLVTLVVDGQGVHAATFPIGGNLFTETIAAKTNSSVEAAETLKRTKNLFSGADALPALGPVVDGWRTEVERILKDWLRENPEVKFKSSSFRFVLSGGGAMQAGLLEYLKQDRKYDFTFWPNESTDNTNSLPGQFAIAFGTALQALGSTPQSASLLPAKLREDWRKQRIHHRLLTGSFFLLFATALLLAIGTWQKIALTGKKEDLLAEAEIALDKAKATKELELELTQNYERLRPVVKRQQQTLDTLKALALLEQSRTNRNLWYVLFADQLSYFSGQTAITNPTPRSSISTPTPAEMLPPRHGFIAELCLQQEGEAMRQTLGQVVAELKQSALFNNVDTVPSDLRKNLANPKVLIPDRHFALALDLGEDEFKPLSTPEKLTGTNSVPVTPPVSRTTSRSNPPPANDF